MATVLELGVLNYFSIIFPGILVFVIVYMLLEKTKMLGESKPLHALAAVVAMFLVMLSKDIVAVINFGAPWFILVFVFLVLLILIYRFMGASEADLSAVIRKDKAIQWTIFAIGVIIVVSSIANIYGQRFLEQGPGEDGVNVSAEEAREAAREEGTYRSELYEAFFNTKVLGLIFIFLVATFTISLITRDAV